jgi:hypothetical protein
MRRIRRPAPHVPVLLADGAGFLEAETCLSVIHGLTDDHMIQELDLNPGSLIDPTGQPHISFSDVVLMFSILR